MQYPTVECPRCKGNQYMLGQEGKVPNYKHNEKGLCFACNGEGTLLKRPDGKLVRFDLETGKWLSYSHVNGSFIGTVEPLHDVVDTEYEIIREKFKMSLEEDELRKKSKVDQIVNKQHIGIQIRRSKVLERLKNIK